MTAVPADRIVWGWTRDALGMPAFRIHPADYPEVEAEGRTLERLTLALRTRGRTPP